jgi:7-cyano-7-deazaguanine synthase
MDFTKTDVLILFSGGIDSTACIKYYKNLNFNIDLIFFDYGQKARKQETEAVNKISDFYQLKITKIQIKKLGNYKDGLVIGRNAAFYFLALMHFQKAKGIIASGIHYGTDYYDCSEGFINEIQPIFDKYSLGTIIAEAPFINFTKGDIINFCKKEKSPLNLTYSCENGKKQPCGKCATCKDLIAINERKK